MLRVSPAPGRRSGAVRSGAGQLRRLSGSGRSGQRPLGHVQRGAELALEARLRSENAQQAANVVLDGDEVQGEIGDVVNGNVAIVEADLESTVREESGGYLVAIVALSTQPIHVDDEICRAHRCLVRQQA